MNASYTTSIVKLPNKSSVSSSQTFRDMSITGVTALSWWLFVKTIDARTVWAIIDMYELVPCVVGNHVSIMIR